MGTKLSFILLIAAVLAGCSHGHCRTKAEAPKPPQPVAASGEGAITPKPINSDRVLVYKYDGSLQCGMGKAVSLDKMAQELGGIPIHSSQKKQDGLMHIQVCGSITGMANVYEIPVANLKQAEGKGFKKWSFE